MHWKTTRTKVAGIVIRNKKILLVKNKRDNFYYLPGGTLEVGESFEECLKREFKEELNCKIKDVKLLGIPSIGPESSKTRKLMIAINFTLTLIGEPKPNNEIIEIKWANYKETTKLKLPEGVILAIKQVKT
ncbi:NUDIX domain-containing protein [Candidatus Micrarchaeota archaeon]|nr:NUDIX domain-containing protein [Candidatus Micrarchaeota archaeon]